MLKERLYGIAHDARSTYWKVAKPVRHGVKVALLSPADELLVVRHSYGTQRWSLPGGGYKPRREPAEFAALREVHEELANVQVPFLYQIGIEVSTREIKRDVVAFYGGRFAVEGAGPACKSPELSDVQLTPFADIHERPDEFSWTVHAAVRMFEEANRLREI